MSLKTILKNVCSFLELLQKARNSKNLNWSTDSFRNAFQWAEYCEKIYHQSFGKVYQQQLNEEIKKLNKLPWTLGELFVDLNFLKNSTGWLALALIQNSKSALTDSRIKYITDKNSKSDFLKNTLEELLAIDNLFKDIISVKMSSGIDMMQPDSKNDELSLIEKLKAETLATLLVDYMQKVLSLDFSDVLMQKMFLKDKLQQLASSSTGMVVIIQAYILLFESVKKEFRNVWKHLDSFVSCVINNSDIEFWESLPRHLVLRLLATNEGYLSKLFKDLEGLSGNFETDYHESFVVKDDGQIGLYSWRYVEDKQRKKFCTRIVSYDWLKGWVASVLSEDQALVVVEASGRVLSRMARSSLVNVWRTICMELNLIELLIGPGD